MPSTLGSNIKHYRLQKGVSQWNLARAIGVAQATVSEWEREYRFPRVTHLTTLANVLGISEAELFNDIPGPLSRHGDHYFNKECLACHSRLSRQTPP